MSANVRMHNLRDAIRREPSLRVACRKCPEVVLLDLAQLIRLFSVKRWNDDFGNVEHKLKCRRCGERYPKLTLVSDEATHSVGPVSEEGWQRMIKRLRG